MCVRTWEVVVVVVVTGTRGWLVSTCPGTLGSSVDMRTSTSAAKHYDETLETLYYTYSANTPRYIPNAGFPKAVLCNAAYYKKAIFTLNAFLVP